MFTNAGFIATYSSDRGPASGMDVYYLDVLAIQEVQVTNRDKMQMGSEFLNGS